MSFSDYQDRIASDMRAIADLFLKAEADVRQGDIAAAQIVAGMGDWQNMLMLRHEFFADCLELGRTEPIVSNHEGPAAK
jgi:hypothetical protein